jgi:hypothetical protein
MTHPAFRVITLCGSTKYEDYFRLVNRYLTLAGNIVFSVGHFPHGESKVLLDEVHKGKIDLSDCIYVINPGGYIGESTWSEIEYAADSCKEIYPLDWDTPPHLSPDLEKLGTENVKDIKDLLEIEFRFSQDPGNYEIPGADTRLRDLGRFVIDLRKRSSSQDVFLEDPCSQGFEI